MSELGSQWPNKPSAEHIGRRLSAADKEPRSDMTLPMQIKTICSRSRKDQRKNFNKDSKAPNGAASGAIDPHSMTIGAPRRAHPPDFLGETFDER